MRKRMLPARFAALMLIISVGTVAAQTPRTEHTYVLDDPAVRPAATLADISWLAGAWEGEAFGSRFEETWDSPSAGSMIGMFKLLKGDQVSFYELMLLVEEEDSLSFKVRHFNPDFSAREGKHEDVAFPLVAIEKGAIHFSGLSFYRINENEMHAYLVFREQEGFREEKLVYRRRR